MMEKHFDTYSLRQIPLMSGTYNEIVIIISGINSSSIVFMIIFIFTLSIPLLSFLLLFLQGIGIWGCDGDSQAVMWAVTDMEAVPAGAMLINPQVL